MTENKRIILNVIATYGRSLYGLALGLFTTRWVLMALGEVDFGLYGVVGGLTSFVIFVNELLAMSVARFFAVNVGAARKNADASAGIDECRKWFNTALLIHTTVPFALVIVGYPVGEWAVRHFLTIPPDRISACVWVWRFTCFSCLVGMVNVPLRAMYTAKQEIAELTIYSFATSTLNAMVLYYMINHPAVWLQKYAFVACLLSVIPNVIIGYRAVVKYPECRFVRNYLWDKRRMSEIASFAAARFFTSFSDILLSQGRQIIVNKYLGPSSNAAMRVGNGVAANSATLAGSLSGAFWPAVANAVGTGDEVRVRRMCFQICRLSTFLVAIFAVPLALESHEVLVLWLKNPPNFSAEICIFILISMLVNRLTEGYWMAIMGFGRRIPFYSWWISWSGCIGFAVTWLLLASQIGMWSICIAILAGCLITLGMRLCLGKVIAQLSLLYWLRSVCLPLSALILLTVVFGLVPRLLLAPSVIRVAVTVLCCEMVLLPCAWRFVLIADERRYISDRFNKVLKKVWLSRRSVMAK